MSLLKSLLMSSAIGIYIVQERKFLRVSSYFQKATGYSEAEILGKDPLIIVHPEDRGKVRKNAVKMLKGKLYHPYEYRAINKKGEILWVMEAVTSIQYQGRRATLGNFMDLTQSRRFEEENTKLKGLLKKKVKEKSEMEKKIFSNLVELILPLLNKLKKTELTGLQRAYLNILQSNLNDIMSPFLARLSSHHLNLTPTEIQVAHLVKEGKSTKEIAYLLQLSPRTVDVHRYNIRKKLGIKDRKTNLKIHLISLILNSAK